MNTGLFDKNGTPINIGNKTSLLGLNAKQIKIMECLSDMPTAYDVDKVVEQLRKEISDCMGGGTWNSEFFGNIFDNPELLKDRG